jgi:hypothetical protein
MLTQIEETLEAHGHAMITSMHEMTFEITKETHLTRRGDCIVAVRASKGAVDLSEEFKVAATNDSARITVVLSAGDMEMKATGRGSGKLQFTHPTDLVARKSTYICPRTLMISSNIAARDFPRRFIDVVKNPDCKITVRLTAEL